MHAGSHLPAAAPAVSGAVECGHQHFRTRPGAPAVNETDKGDSGVVQIIVLSRNVADISLSLHIWSIVTRKYRLYPVKLSGAATFERRLCR
eukprot:3171714-Pleurochrysis_carterae.AAC.1